MLGTGGDVTEPAEPVKDVLMFKQWKHGVQTGTGSSPMMQPTLCQFSSPYGCQDQGLVTHLSSSPFSWDLLSRLTEKRNICPFISLSPAHALLQKKVGLGGVWVKAMLPARTER